MVQARLFLLLFMYVGTGVMQPLLISTLGFLGAFERSTLLFLLPNYIGMSLAALVRCDAFTTGTFRKRRLAVLCLIDVVSQLMCNYGLTMTGSSLYSIIYSTVTIWIAVESRILIKRKLSMGQWMGCAIVVGGVAIAGGKLSTNMSDKSGAEVAMGAGMTLVGSVAHGMTYVLIEMLLTEDNPIRPEAASAIMGCSGVAIFGLWQLAYTLPRAQDLVVDPIIANGGRIGPIVVTGAVLVMDSLVHALIFYHLVGSAVSSVTAGLMKGCQATAVFIASHVLFCSTQESQCFTSAKAWSLVLVVVGTMTYALSKQHKQESPELSSDYRKI